MNHRDMMANDINAMLDNAQPQLTDYCCIYKVPFDIRRLNDDAYTPKVISIGPFHHRHHQHPRLQNMERHKLIYFKAFLERAEATIQPLIHYVDSIVPNFRHCYSETLDFTDQELVELILIDSAFIIELFCRSYNNVAWSQVDALLLKPCIANNIRLDLLLLENQLPFFVVEKIFNISFSAKTNFPSFLELTYYYFSYYNKSNLASNNNDISIRHFTDLIRIFYLQHPMDKRPRRIDESMNLLHSVTELLEAGVRFKVNTESKCLLDLRFSGGVLEIPQLRVEDMTEILLRNMVALEQCHYPYESYITDYIGILDFLINTGRDADILVKKGILVNWLGDSDSVANLFNSIGKNVALTNSNFDYYVLCKDLNDFFNDPLHKLKATLRRDYCSNPWQTAATVAGILLLILSLLQSVCSVLQVV
ncbi:UPF0481 protein At3g47200-like isoform X1 [Vicia villosa]|uniref:UPF0481 protein At3g47200-like isoform X1 n=1 Tax=Vicia villosa TaxID=3911 RepID=UPI00273B40C9|nr:UPF0481 protein At3g47200-like isoform X1 [Vicia villosa]